jgi:hypothetical protein
MYDDVANHGAMVLLCVKIRQGLAQCERLRTSGDFAGARRELERCKYVWDEAHMYYKLCQWKEGWDSRIYGR